MPGSGRTFEEATRKIADSFIFFLGRSKSGSAGGSSASGYQGAACAGELLQLLQRVQRDALHVGQNDSLVSVGAQDERASFNFSSLFESVIVEQIEVESRP